MVIREEMSTLSNEGRYGYAPREKPENSFCLMFETCNDVGVFMGKSKICRVNDYSCKLEVDCLAGCKLQCDWRFTPNEDKFKNSFKVGKKTSSGVGNNVSERKEISQRDQKGGTAIVAMGIFVSYELYVGCNYTGLGRRSWILVGS